MAVKKIFQPLIALLEANSAKSVKNIMAEVLELASAKGAGGVATASHKGADGKVIAVRCSYFAKWFPISHVPFGAKDGSATGMNPMCKEAANLFSQKQREYKKGKEDILDQVSSGKLAPEKITKELEKLEKIRNDRGAYSVPGMGWDELEDCLKQTPTSLDKLVKAHADKLAADAAEQKKKDDTAAAAAAKGDGKNATKK